MRSPTPPGWPPPSSTPAPGPGSGDDPSPSTVPTADVLYTPFKERSTKQLVQRQRPGTTVPDAILRGVPHGGLSFTSGHAIITFAIAGLLVLVLPRRWGVLAIALAACNGLARVYLGAHNPLDVVGGAAIGLIIAAVLDMVLDVARDRGRPLWLRAPARENRAS